LIDARWPSITTHNACTRSSLPSSPILSPSVSVSPLFYLYLTYTCLPRRRARPRAVSPTQLRPSLAVHRTVHCCFAAGELVRTSCFRVQHRLPLRVPRAPTLAILTTTLKGTRTNAQRPRAALSVYARVRGSYISIYSYYSYSYS